MQNETLVILILVNGLILMLIYLANRRTKKQWHERQLASIQLNLSLKALLLNIQKQRGLCARMLNGEPGLRPEIQSLFNDNERAFNDIEFSYSHFLQEEPRWATIRGDWVKLKEDGLSEDLEHSFVSHNLLIENIIFMIGDVAYRSRNDIELTLANEEIRIIWANIPQTLEAMGQARAIGSGVASAGVCSQANKIRLRFLCDEMRSHFTEVRRQLNVVSVGEIQHLSADISPSLNGLIDVINDKLVIPEKPEIASEDFFDQASQAMDGVSHLFDTLSAVKQHQIERIMR